MSKAFTRESDDAPEPPLRRRASVPVGVPNYVTADGARALRAEHEALTARARAGEHDGDPRLHEIAEHLATAEIVEPPAQPRDRVTFGAAVTVEDDDGARARYRIVGVIEAAPRTGDISWQSPLARALLGAPVGDTVTAPGRGALEIVAIDAD